MLYIHSVNITEMINCSYVVSILTNCEMKLIKGKPRKLYIIYYKFIIYNIIFYNYLYIFI